MKTLVFAVYDAAARAYLQPFHSQTKATAVRSFSDAVNDEKSQFGKYAADYHLALVGQFDDNTGLYESPNAPERIIGASECMMDFVFPPDKEIKS